MSEPPWLERGERSQQRRQLAAPGDRRASLNRTRGSLFRFRAEAAETEAAPARHPLEFVTQKKSGGAVPVGITGSRTLGRGGAALARNSSSRRRLEARGLPALRHGRPGERGDEGARGGGLGAARRDRGGIDRVLLQR